jgi:hypothetical protein
MNTMIAAIVEDDASAAKTLLEADAGLAKQKILRAKLYKSGIIQEFLSIGLSPNLKCGRGKRVMDCARSLRIRQLLAGSPADPDGSRPRLDYVSVPRRRPGPRRA